LDNDVAKKFIGKLSPGSINNTHDIICTLSSKLYLELNMFITNDIRVSYYDILISLVRGNNGSYFPAGWFMPDSW